jgi:hypothetical protein
MGKRQLSYAFLGGGNGTGFLGAEAAALDLNTWFNDYAALERGVASLRELVKSRVAGGTVVRLDGKNPCPAGRWGNNWAFSRTNLLDPAHCFRDRDAVQPPALRLNVPCSQIGTLFWPDVYTRCQSLLRMALGMWPREGQTWITDVHRANWTRWVMELVSMALEATNIQPIFLFPAKWSTDFAFLARGGGSNDPIQKWGNYSTAYSADDWDNGVRAHAWNTSADQWMTGSGGPPHLYGRGLPANVHRALINAEIRSWERWNTARAAVMRNALGGAPYDIPGAPWTIDAVRGRADSRTSGYHDPLPYESPTQGLHFERTNWGHAALTIFPAMMAGSNISENSQTLRALLGDHDPWSTTGFTERHDLLDWNLMLLPDMPANMLDVIARNQFGASLSPWGRRDWSTIQRVYLYFAGVSADAFMRSLFRHTHGQSAEMVPGTRRSPEKMPPAWEGGPFTNTAQWYTDVAGEWAQAIINRSFTDIVIDSTLFYLVNHNAYYKRLYGEAAGSLSTEAAAQLAATLRDGRMAMMRAGATVGNMLVNLVNPIAGAVVNMVSDAIMNWMRGIWSAPDTPKTLFRRLPASSACDLAPGGSASVTDAARAAIDEARKGDGLALPCELLGNCETTGKTSPWLIGAGVAGALIGGGLLIKVLRK